MTIHMKAIEQYCHMEQFIKLYKVVLTFTFMDGTIACDHSSESYCTFIWEW